MRNIFSDACDFERANLCCKKIPDTWVNKFHLLYDKVFLREIRAF